MKLHVTTTIIGVFSLLEFANGSTGALRNSRGPAIKPLAPLPISQAPPLNNPQQVATCTPGCPTDATCILDNTNNQAVCVCDEPEFEMIDGTCVEKNQCLDTTTCPSDKICSNLPGGFACKSCLPGYAPDQTFTECVEIDECLSPTLNTCTSTQVCVNNPAGSYTCEDCPAGYEAQNNDCVDLDECSMGAHTCTSNEICTNTIGHFTCQECPSGYIPDQTSSDCVFVDPCLSDQNTCTDDQLCVPSDDGILSFTCQECPKGYTANKEDGTCVDKNECLDGTHSCDADQVCSNTNGGYICGEFCKPGRVPSPELGVCVDDNECLDSSKNTCDDNNQVCFNNDGGYDCGATCPEGTVPDNSARQCVPAAAAAVEEQPDGSSSSNAD